ncbi:MAG: GNAT family N-acetyltransferase [bacterium]|nr:GNAT family N-acetyltransferase [bacterium]
MPDMLVKLYALPPLETVLANPLLEGIDLRRGLGAEKHLVLSWIRRQFWEAWASETDVAFARAPVSCFIAVQDNIPVGFSCYDTTRKGFFGPIGTDDAVRGRGVGKALLLLTLYDMWANGYGYAIIGGVGPADFYAKACGAVLIPDSAPGVYRGMLRPPETE